MISIKYLAVIGSLTLSIGIGFAQEQTNRGTEDSTVKPLSQTPGVVARGMPISQICFSHAFEVGGRDVDTALKSSQVEDLRHLAILGCHVTNHGLGHISGSRIEVLTIHCPVTFKLTNDELRHIGRMTHMRCLSIRDSAITDEGVWQLAGLESIEELWLVRSEVTGSGFRGLADIPRLSCVCLNGCKELNDDDCEAITCLSALRELYVADTPIGDDALRHFSKLKNLRTLVLDGTNVTGGGLREHLSKLPHLALVSISGTRVTRAELQELQELLVNAHVHY